MSNRRVVVTGLGIITPLGLGLKQNWQKILTGSNSISKLETNGILEHRIINNTNK